MWYDRQTLCGIYAHVEILVRAQTLDDVIKPYLHLPTAIQTALVRVETHPTFRSITKSTLLVLKALVSRASATNGTRIIHARLDRLAEEANVSYKTVQRALRQFHEFKWASPASEGRSEWGVFEAKRYRLSPDLCALVHLPTKEKTASELEQETELSDGAIYVDLSLKKDLRKISIENRNGEPPKLPAAVEHVPGETGISPTGICKLLGIARKAGYQLEHVILVAKPYLAKIGTASPGRAFRYLQAMLTNPKKVDYAGRAAQLERGDEPDPAKAMLAIAKQCRHKKFVHATKPGLLVRFFDGVAEVSCAGQVETLAGRQLEVLYADVAKGKLTEVIE
ncbi:MULTISPECIES: hypothetical protein [unclassified Janthinobacterium]|uniref:hypothetical protein n=1 Tax=unclassified Janthinobacterium TaxID=2610881 RepID=UPI00160991FC|nr:MULTISPECIES: hypothetical protein [unclassified Janthinobacterium]MBB5610577.1 hypothetical protein [Janthinobacterium sp. S3T4]MBB5615969.1 hypothetical protein [Janthinobacterium sp. S3M3]